MLGRILVVDDSPTVLAYTSSVLTRAGYAVRTCDTIWVSGDVAAFHPDLLLVDVNMGTCQGTSVVQALRDRSFVDNAVIVLYSALCSEELEELAKRCGADGYLCKRNDPEHLASEVRRFLAREGGEAPGRTDEPH